MKRAISFFLVLCLAVSAFVLPVCSVSIDSGKQELVNQFAFGQGPNVDGFSLDYRYYSPVKENDYEKYPLVVWLHGHSHGMNDGFQLESNNIANWSSEEFQGRMTGSTGFFVLAARAPEDKGFSWSDRLTKQLKYTIDSFILENRDNIDTTRIYLGGFSLGGMMTLKMATLYPEMFAAYFPICPYIVLTEEQGNIISDKPVWLTSGVQDTLVDYEEYTLVNWNVLKETATDKTFRRFSSLDPVCNPDGTPAITQHYSWEAVTGDMFSSEGGDYPYMVTVDGNGDTVYLTCPNGIISWLSGFSSYYSADDIDISDTGSDEAELTLLDKIKALIMKIYVVIRNLIRPITDKIFH